MVYIKDRSSFGTVWWGIASQGCLMVPMTLLMTVWVVSGRGIDWPSDINTRWKAPDSTPVKPGMRAGFKANLFSSTHLVDIFMPMWFQKGFAV